MKKKVLYIHHGKGIGGAPLSLLYLIQALDKTQYEPIVLFLHDSDAMKLYRSQGITVIGPTNTYDFPHTKIWWLHWYHAPMTLRVLLDTVKTLFKTADFWLDQIKPDIVHLNTSSLVAWGKVAKKKGIRVVWHIREPLADGYVGARKTFIKKYVGRYADAILPICEHDATPWHDNPKTTVVYNAVQPMLFNPLVNPEPFLKKHRLSASSPKILFLGGLSEEKGTLIILTIFEKLLARLPQAQLLIAGYFDTHQPCQHGYKRFFPANVFKKRVMTILEKVKNSVHLLGPINNVPQALAASHVLVFPATVGHFARPVIEAGFMKKPVIASNLKPMDELVINNQTGFLLDYHDHDTWVEKLYLLLTDQELNNTMGQAAFDVCTKNFSLKKQREQIENVYTRVLAKGNS